MSDDVVNNSATVPALTYGVAMSIALVVYVYRYRGRRMMRR